MDNHNATDRADATVWLPLLQILGGVAERVARGRSDNPCPGPDAGDLAPPEVRGRGGDASESRAAPGPSLKGGRR